MRRLLDFVFSQHDLAWIDNIIPEKEKKKEDDKKKKKKGNKGDGSSDEEVGAGCGGLPWTVGAGKVPPKRSARRVWDEDLGFVEEFHCVRGTGWLRGSK